MSKTKRNLWKLFTFMLVLCATVLFNGKDVFAASNSVQFISVAEYNGYGKGDATLITFKGNYYLVDTGVSAAYAEGTPLYNRLSKLDKPLSGIIITHCHSDHMGALKKIANSKAVSSTKTVLYLNKSHLYAQDDLTVENNTLDKLKDNWLKDANFTGKFASIKEIASKTVTTIAGSGNNALIIYGSTLTQSKIKTTADENNCSMVVQLKSNDINALLLGDLVLGSANGGGVLGLKAVYGSQITGVSYNVCKVGHHGRRSVNEQKYIGDEMTNFYNLFNSKYYMLTGTENAITQDLVNALKARGAVRYSKTGSTWYTFPKQ